MKENRGWVAGKTCFRPIRLWRTKFAFSGRMEGLENLPVRLNNQLGACRSDKSYHEMTFTRVRKGKLFKSAVSPKDHEIYARYRKVRSEITSEIGNAKAEKSAQQPEGEGVLRYMSYMGM